MLQEAGYPIDDIAEEIERIQKRAFGQAARLADATGDNGAVREYLGLPEADPTPTVPLVQAPAAQGTLTSPPQAQPLPPAPLQPAGKTGIIGEAAPGPR
ncbi:hypothetical protein ABZ079_35555 [Streptomyces sp. NPDC006314]|uniref:hypothetical protein n=1 Tax=Streptomyces sp. NPDC006314 TaxID=3154475 RepID=UPI0033A5175F